MANEDEVPSIIERGAPNAVTYDLSSDDFVRITLPQNSTWSSGLHFHKTHTEYLSVRQGTIKVRLGSAVQTITATADSQPELRVDRFVWHEWQRAEPGGDDVVVVERTDPEDGEKAVFFWNLNGVILNAPKMLQDPSSAIARCPPMLRGLALDSWVSLSLFGIFYHLDNIPVFLNTPDLVRRAGFHETSSATQKSLEAVDAALSYFILYIASLLGYLLGISPVCLEYTPGEKHAAWRAKNQSTKRKAL